MIGTMCVCLLVAPQTASYMPHVGQQSSGMTDVRLNCMWDNLQCKSNDDDDNGDDDGNNDSDDNNNNSKDNNDNNNDGDGNGNNGNDNNSDKVGFSSE